MDATQGQKEDSTEARRTQALNWCQQQIDWFEKSKRNSSTADRIAQVIIIVMSSLTPILILWSYLPKVLQALPAALITVTVGLSQAFHWRENHIRYAQTGEALQSERIKFLTRAGSYRTNVSENTAIRRFVERIESLHMSEIEGWSVDHARESPETIPAEEMDS